jgi:hypothetical protein
VRKGKCRFGLLKENKINMTATWMKFLSKLDKKTRFRLEVILKKILENNFD